MSEAQEKLELAYGTIRKMREEIQTLTEALAAKEKECEELRENLANTQNALNGAKQRERNLRKDVEFYKYN